MKLAIIYGGKSAEHEVSLVSAGNVLAALDRKRFEPMLFFVDHDGTWYLEDSIKEPSRRRPLGILPGATQMFYEAASGKALAAPDVVFPIIHGPQGEDGTLQGLLEMLALPYVGPGVLGSAVGMDKDACKRLLCQSGIPVARWICLESSQTIPFAAVQAELGYPCFVKPANMGSSVGVSRVESESGLEAALKEAFLYDSKVLIEEAVNGREIECAVLGNKRPEASLPGEISMEKGFYSYDAKYVDAGVAKLHAPADLSPETAARVKDLAVSAFRALCCEGMGRVDFFLRPDGSLLVNEINTIPGFTNISMYPKLWEVSGLPQKELISRLIDLALERQMEKSRLRTTHS